MNELALFAGAGGGILGGKLLGWRTICAVEWDGYARDVLVARQNDGCLDPFPVWDDVQTFDGHPWRGRVDVISGGFPCQDISCAGKGAGIDGDRSSMWSHMARIIGEVRPRFVFVENSPMLVGRGLARVLVDLAEMGYDARWGVLGAHHVGAPHKRDRIWIVADAISKRGRSGDARREDAMDADPGGKERMLDAEAIRRIKDVCDQTKGREIKEKVGNSNSTQREGGWVSCGIYQKNDYINGTGAWWDSDPADAIEPKLDRVAHGVANRVDRLRCIGNGQVPAVAALAWNTLTDHRDHTADTNNEQINAK